jgi:hypothetical protein
MSSSPFSIWRRCSPVIGLDQFPCRALPEEKMTWSDDSRLQSALP